VASSYLDGESPAALTNYDVAGIRCVDKMDYWRGLNAAWSGPGTLVNVEHDMECTDELVRQLVDCPWPACSHAYRVWLSDRQQFVFAARSSGGGWVDEGVTAADYAGVGFCKIEQTARSFPLRRGPWIAIEQAVNQAVGEWHIHWPAVEHYHPYIIDPAAVMLQTSGVMDNGAEVVFQYGGSSDGHHPQSH
jgi:hypothetical protein